VISAAFLVESEVIVSSLFIKDALREDYTYEQIIDYVEIVRLEIPT
jgi:hypothetical protein